MSGATLPSANRQATGEDSQVSEPLQINYRMKVLRAEAAASTPRESQALGLPSVAAPTLASASSTSPSTSTNRNIYIDLDPHWPGLLATPAPSAPSRLTATPR